MPIKLLKNFLLNNKLFVRFYLTTLRKFHLLWVNRERKIYRKIAKALNDKSGLEIGGPSPIFEISGPTPFYKIVKNLDNINFSDKTSWDDNKDGGDFIFNQNKASGRQIITDATNLSAINDNQYEFLLSCHNLEHIANPIKAILEWKRVLKTDSFIVLVLPNKWHTYDINRPFTKIRHLIDDFENNIQETDDTHAQEVIEMFDVHLDSTVTSLKEHIKRTAQNFDNRVMHHHVFDVELIKDVFKYVEIEYIDSEIFDPYHIVVVGQKIK
jgi:SAM-dependent methyltransferase